MRPSVDTTISRVSEGISPPDLVLLTQIWQRDETALGVLFERYRQLVYAIALRITGDSMAAEEVVQDVFHAVWQSAASFQSSGNVGAWVAGIARHRAIDHTRTQRFRVRAHEELLDDHVSVSINSSDSAVDILALRETMRVALLALPLVQRQTLALAYYADLSHAEIALRVAQPLGTIKSRIRLGLNKLRELLEEG